MAILYHVFTFTRALFFQHGRACHVRQKTELEFYYLFIFDNFMQFFNAFNAL